MAKIEHIIKNPKLYLTILHDKMCRYMSDEKYLKMLYNRNFGKKLDLNNPITFNEKLQWLKLNDRNPLYTTLVDKYAVKEYVAKKIGSEYVIPTIGIYDKVQDIDWESLPNQFVIKCTHDSGGLVVCKDKLQLNIDSAKAKLSQAMKTNYFLQGREWPYKNVKPRIIIEKYIELGNKNEHIDYKFMTFNGEMKVLFCDVGVIDEEGSHSQDYFRNIYDKNFSLLPVLETRENTPQELTKPKNFETMISIANKLAQGIPHARIDLYNIEGKIYFGEITFYHGSGLCNKFEPAEWDKKFGDWIDLSKAYCYRESNETKE